MALPEHVEPVHLPRQLRARVVCGGCEREVHASEMRKCSGGKRRCLECITKERNARQEAGIVETVQRLILQRLDLETERSREGIQPPDPAEILDSFYEAFGGAREFGDAWARLCQGAVDKAMKGEGSYQVAARLMLDVFRATSRTNDTFQQRDLDRMSLEEIQAAKRSLILSEMGTMARDAVGKRLLGVLAAIASEDDPNDSAELLNEIQQVIAEYRPERVVDGEVVESSQEELDGQ